jgi:single-strand DNA-binding protein
VTTTARNEVVLVGRLAAPPQDRTLPSGHELVTWSLVVDRPVPARPTAGRRPPTVDTLECVAWTAAVQRAAARWQVGDTVSVEGALHRRFWQGPHGAVSRYEVEVLKARRVARTA